MTTSICWLWETTTCWAAFLLLLLSRTILVNSLILCPSRISALLAEAVSRRAFSLIYCLIASIFRFCLDTSSLSMRSILPSNF